MTLPHSTPHRLLKLQGSYFLITGIWPILHMKSFEKISGPKHDHWLVKTVGTLIAVTGGVLLSAVRRKSIPLEVTKLAQGQALALGTVDVIYSTRGRISKIYLLDAFIESLILMSWRRTLTHS